MLLMELRAFGAPLDGRIVQVAPGFTDFTIELVERRPLEVANWVEHSPGRGVLAGVESAGYLPPGDDVTVELVSYDEGEVLDDHQSWHLKFRKV